MMYSYNRTAPRSTTEWFASAWQWYYYDGAGWTAFSPVATDLLVANVTHGVHSLQASNDASRPHVIAGIAAGVMADRSDVVFSRGDDMNVMITGDFLTPALVAISSSRGSSMWDLFGRPGDSEERVWNEWPQHAPDPTGVAAVSYTHLTLPTTPYV